MGKIKDLAGKRFSMLTVSKLIKTEAGQTWWECICDCGNRVETTNAMLRTGHKKSCGCKKMYKSSLVGMRFRRLLVIRETEPLKKHKGRYWECRCDCGNYVIKNSKYLSQGDKQSCGCLNAEIRQKINATHEMSNTDIYKRWKGMLKRCKYNKYYTDVEVCPEWNDFDNFYEWAMKNGYEKNLTIDRINPYGNYEPSNCRWVDMKVQSNNKRNNSYYTVDGETHTLTEWIEMYGLDIKTVLYRLKKGMSMKEALTEPLKNRPKKVIWIEGNKEYKSIRECAMDVGVSHTMVSGCMSGRFESVRGYHFKYAGDQL